MAETPLPNPNAKVRLEFMGQAFTWFGRAWKEWCIATLPIAVLFGIYAILSYRRGHLDLSRATDPEGAQAMPVSMLGLAIPFMVLYYILFCGLIQMGVKQVRGESVSWTDGFSLGPNPIHVVLAVVWLGLLTATSFALCCLPALVVVAGSMLTFPLVTDKGLGAFQAFRLSWATAGRQIWTCIGLMIFGTGISLASSGIVALGALIGVPIYALTFALVYHEFFNSVDQGQVGFEI